MCVDYVDLCMVLLYDCHCTILQLTVNVQNHRHNFSLMLLL